MNTMRYKDHKEKRRDHEGNSRYITTCNELKGFTKQVQEARFGDKKFEKAYERFKRPVYYSNNDQNILPTLAKLYQFRGVTKMVRT